MIACTFQQSSFNIRIQLNEVLRIYNFVQHINIQSMSEIILNWLNDQIQLSKRINNFEEDFHNGYLFGELLAKYNQQLNFNQFLNKDDKKAKIKNFQLLFDTFVSLGVSFNSNVANEVINKKQGVSKKLLYELKMHLEKTSSNAFTKLTKMTKTLSPLKKIKVSKDQYDKVDKEHFVKQLNELRPAQKSVNQEKLLRKFSDFHDQQKINSLNVLEKQHQQSLLERKKFRDKERQNLKKTTDFRNQWQRSNVQKWSANMTVRKIQHEKDHMYKSKLENTKFQNKTMSELNAIKALDKDISAFQKKFVKKKKLDFDHQQDSDSQSEHRNQKIQQQNIQDLTRKESTKLCSKLKFSKTQKESSFQISLKKKKVPQDSEQSKHQRQKKRRKMIVEQNKRYQLIQISRRQKYILSTIQQTSKQQKQLQYQIWRVWQNKQIIKENKSIHEEKQRDKVETKLINNNFKKDQLLKTYREQHEKQVKDSINRQQKLLRDQKVKERKSIYQQCKEMVEDFINVSEQCFLYQQQKNESELSSDLLEHLFSQFVEGAKTNEEIAQLQLSNYINGKGEWNIKLQRPQGLPEDPSQQNALPNKVVNNYTLGNILRYLYESKFNLSEQNNQKVPQQQKNSKSEYLFSLLGLEFSGKHEVARAVKERYGFHIIEIENLIMRRMAEYEEIKDKVTQISADTQQLVELAYQGRSIPDRLIIKLIVQELQKNPKSILINYPITYEQSIQLTKALGDVSPSDFISKTELQQKITSFCRLVSPTKSKILPRPIQQCGLDLALWLQISPKISFDRYLGRQWLKNGQRVHIRDQIADKVGQLLVGEKSSSAIMRNHDRIIQKKNLQSFFNQFGIQAVKKTVENISHEQIKPESKQQNGQIIRKQQEGSQKPVEKQSQNIQNNAAEKVKLPQEKPAQEKENQNKAEGNPTQRQVIEKRLRKSWESINGDCSIPELIDRACAVFQQVMDVKDFKKEITLLNKKQKQIALQTSKKQQILQQQIKQKCCLSSNDKIQQKLQKSLESVKMQKQFTEQLCGLWNRVQQSTVASLTNVFKFISEQQKEKNNYISSTKRNYILMLTREDNKFSQVKQFQMEYNKFFDQNPDMVSQDYTKDQLHQRVDDLEDQLFDCIQQKKGDATEQRKNIMECGWLESQLEQFYNCARIMLQAELNRFSASQKILSDFYSKKYAIPQQPYEEANTEIPYDTTLEMYNRQTKTYPRLQKLISQTLRIFNKEEEVVDDKNKKGGKAPPKKDDKKGGKKNQVEQPKQPTPQQVEMKKAINTQKAIFRYRVNIIQEFSTKKVTNLIEQGENLYKDIESYYLYTYDIENKTVFNLSKIFRSKIESEQKIQNQVQINYVDVIQTEKIRNFQKQKPTILAAKEVENEQRFTVANILETLKFIQNQSQSLQKISTKRLAYVFNHLQTNQTGKHLLPLKWRSLSFTDIEKFICKLDSAKRGYIELEKIYIPIIMSNFTVPDQKQLGQFFNQLTQYGTQLEISKEKMINTASWFDTEQKVQQNVRTFERTKLIKQILFDVLKVKRQRSQQEVVNAQELMEMLKLRNIKEALAGQTYFECAFEKYQQ